MMHLFTVKRLAAATALAWLLPSLNTAVANNEVTLDFKGFLPVVKLKLLLTQGDGKPGFHVRSNPQLTGVDDQTVRKWLAHPDTDGAWKDPKTRNDLLPHVFVSTNGLLEFRYWIGDCLTSGQTQNVTEAKNSSKEIPQTQRYHANPSDPVASQIKFVDPGNSKKLTDMEHAASATGSDNIDPIQLGWISSELQGGPFQPVFFECSAESIEMDTKNVHRVRKVYQSGQTKPLDGTLYLGMNAYSAGSQNLAHPDDGAGGDRIGWIVSKSNEPLKTVSYLDATYMFVTNTASGKHNRASSPFPWHNRLVKRVVATNKAFLKSGARITSMATHTANWKIGPGKFNKDVAKKLNDYLKVVEQRTPPASKKAAGRFFMPAKS